MNDNGRPARPVKCDCGECGCDQIALQNDPEIAPICYYCEHGQHRNNRVKGLEKELMKAKGQIAQLEKVTRKM